MKSHGRHACAWRQSLQLAESQLMRTVNMECGDFAFTGGKGYLPDLLRHTRNLQRTLDFTNSNIGIPRRPGNVDDDQVMSSWWGSDAGRRQRPGTQR